MERKNVGGISEVGHTMRPGRGGLWGGHRKRHIPALRASSPRRSALGRRRAMRCTAATTALLLSVSHRSRPAQMAAGDQDSGYPISPELRPADVLLRYFYDGGTLRQGRLCRMITPADTDTVSGLALLHALHDDGVDLECFYPCVRETEASGGSWLRFLRGVVGAPPAEVEGGDDITLPLPRRPPVGAGSGGASARAPRCAPARARRWGWRACCC